MMDRQTVLTAGVVALMTGVGVIFAAVSARLYKEPVEPVMCTPTTVVQEQPAPARQQGGMPQDVQELNLSDVQKTKIRVIVQRFRPQVTSAREKQRSQYEQRMEKILRKPTFDEEEARSTIAKYRQENAGKKQEYAEHELQLMRQKHAIFQVLTPEQQEQYLHLRSAHAAYDEY